MSRRKSLALIRGGVFVAAVASKGGFLAARRPFEAIKPWKAGLQGKDRLSIYRNKTRNFPVTDPHSRQLTIGTGCFLELMDMAAAQELVGVETTLYPQGEGGPVAVSQAFQECPEIKQHYEEVNARLVPKGETVRMLGLLEYGERTRRTPRWPIESRMTRDRSAYR